MTYTPRRLLSPGLLVTITILPSTALAQRPVGEREVVAVVDSFHISMGRGDSAAVLAFLAPDAVIIESGEVETLAEYRAHHLPADIAFARSVRTRRSSPRVSSEGMVAWVAATTTVSGSYRGRRVDSQGAELMVLSQARDGWRIRAIHWSSHAK
jgi:ketosteroid isomerase-like protein